MIRFIKNILDIKNLLGMQRVVPPTPPTPIGVPQIRLHSWTDCEFIPTFSTGELIVQYGDGHGNLIEERYDTSYSGTQIIINHDPGSYYIDIVNTTSRLLIDSIETLNNIDDVVINRNVLNVRIPQQVERLNFSNSYTLNLTVTPTMSLFNIMVLEAAAWSIEQRDACLAIINNNIGPGTLYISADDPYAADVITAATAQGWEIYT